MVTFYALCACLEANVKVISKDPTEENTFRLNDMENFRSVIEKFPTSWWDFIWVKLVSVSGYLHNYKIKKVIKQFKLLLFFQLLDKSKAHFKNKSS